MKVVYNHTNCKSSLNVRNPSPISEGVPDSAPLDPPFGDSREKARGKVCNALPMEPPICPEKTATPIYSMISLDLPKWVIN
jgi:hypothetical protein